MQTGRSTGTHRMHAGSVSRRSPRASSPSPYQRRNHPPSSQRRNSPRPYRRRSRPRPHQRQSRPPAHQRRTGRPPARTAPECCPTRRRTSRRHPAGAARPPCRRRRRAAARGASPPSRPRHRPGRTSRNTRLRWTRGREWTPADGNCPRPISPPCRRRCPTRTRHRPARTPGPPAPMPPAAPGYPTPAAPMPPAAPAYPTPAAQPPVHHAPAAAGPAGLSGRPAARSGRSTTVTAVPSRPARREEVPARRPAARLAAARGVRPGRGPQAAPLAVGAPARPGLLLRLPGLLRHADGQSVSGHRQPAAAGRPTCGCVRTPATRRPPGS